ncbi:MAG: hypothetical protein AB4352_19100 [Hormoscilla sp.]
MKKRLKKQPKCSRIKAELVAAHRNPTEVAPAGPKEITEYKLSVSIGASQVKTDLVTLIIGGIHA